MITSRSFPKISFQDVYVINNIGLIAPSGLREVAFIDSSVTDYATLVEALPPGVDVVVLDGNRDGLTQIVEWAAGHTGYDAIHVLSHGAPGLWMLGDANLDIAALDARAAELAALGRTLAAAGDLLLYGCSIGAERAFVVRLAALTGVSVAASAVPTGAAALGGCWKLDVTAGPVGTSAFAVERFAGLLGVDATFDFGTGADDPTGASTQTYTSNGETITFTVTSGAGKLYFAQDAASTGGTGILGDTDFVNMSGRVMATNLGDDLVTTVRISVTGKIFDLASFNFSDFMDAGSLITLTSDKGSFSFAANTGVMANSVDLSANANFQGVAYVDVTSADGGFLPIFDNVALLNITPPGPQFTSATYDAATGVLTVAVTTAFGTPMAAGNTIDVSKLTLTGEGGETRALTSANVTATNATSFSVTLNAADLAAVNQILNKAGTSSTGGTPFNLAGAANWNTSVASAADTTGNAVTVSNPTTPTIASATYNATTGVLMVTGTGFLKLNGANNDIDVSKLTLTGEGGATRTLTTASVEIASATSFSVTLNPADLAAVNLIFNKNGTSATSGTTYNLSAAEDWAAGADAAVVVADTTGNGITVSNVPVPAITSATYDATTGVLTVTGTGFLKLNGANNDIDVSKLTLTGEGGATRTLTTASVEIASATSFSVTLNPADLAAVNLIFNKNGTSATSGTTYNLSAAEDWAAGADAAVVVADTTGNGITVSNVPVPTITSATYDATTGVLTVTGTGFLKLNGANNDIDVSKLTLTGEGGDTYTLTTGNVEITNGTSFSVTLSAADKAAVNQMLNKAGTASTGTTTYNLAAAEDWAAGADAAVNVVDATSAITVSNVPVPALTSATYDYATNTLIVTGSGFLKRVGVNNDIDVSKLGISGGGGEYVLTSASNVEIDSATQFTITLTGADLYNVEALLNKNGTTSVEGSPYNLAAAEDWAAGADAAVAVADTTGNGITVSNWAAPAITSATFDVLTGQLVLTGTDFVNASGANNDLVAGKLTFTGQGGSHTLLDSADVEIASATSATVTLSAADRLIVLGLLNKNGTAAGDATTYNLAAADGWLAGSPAAADITDATTGITVANAQTPTITSAVYDSDSGELTVTGANLFKKPGAANDIDVSRFTLTGQGSATYTLTSASDVEITSATSFSVTLSGADKTGVDALLDQIGTVSSGGTTYNLAAADDWLAAADGAANIADATNAVTVVINPKITSATYDAGTGTLVVTGTNIQANGGGADIDASRFILTGEGGATYTLTDTADVERDSVSQFTLTLSATDKAAVNQMLNQAGAVSTGGTTYNLAAADDWCINVTAGDTADATNAVTVGTVPVPTITSAAYDASTGLLTVTGTGFLKRGGADNDIDVSRLTLTGEDGSPYTLTTGNVEITSGTSFSVTLNAADKVAVSQMLNKAGASSTGGTAYNLAAAEDWAAGAAAAVVVADTTGNGITVSNPTTPTITSASYDASAGVFTVTGSGFLKRGGATNDVVASKFTVTGEGGATYTLTDTANVEIASATSFTLILSVTDKTALDGLFNKNGTSAVGGGTYNLAAAEDWAAGADAAVNVADATNAVTVSGVPVPAITSASYDASTGVLTVTGTGFIAKSGANNDIDVSRLTLTGEDGSPYTLTTGNVEITSGTSFSVTLNATDKAAVNQIFNKAGASSTGGTTYNLAAAEDWAAGADAADTVADLTGNGVTVSNPTTPTITSATYDAATGVLAVTGTGFLKRAGTANDVVASKFTFTGEGGATYTLTDTANVDIADGTSFSLTLSAADRAAVNQMLNKDGATATGGGTYNLAAAEDWAAGADAAVNVADATSTVTVGNVPVPTIISASYDTSTGVLTVTGTGFLKLGADDDIDVSKLALTGKGGSPYTLTTGNVEIASGTSFSVTLNATDKAAVNALLDKNGTSSNDATPYNLAAAEDWAKGADSAVVVADTTGNGITVTGHAPPGGGGGGSTPPLPPPPPGTPTGTYDGVTIGNTTTPGSGGTTITTVSIPVVTDTRVDDPHTSNRTHADIPLALDTAGDALLAISVPVGVGLSAEQVSGGNQTLRDILIAASNPRIASDAAFQEVLETGIDAYVPTVADESQVTVRTVTFTAAGQSPGAPIIVTGALGTGEADPAHPLRQEALVLDVRALPAGTVLQLDDVEFAIVIGASRVVGGEGRNFVVGDDAAQFIVLGADDDQLYGGAGDDTVASKGGDDHLFGDAGNDRLVGGTGDDTLYGGEGDDLLQGGASDAGTWSVFRDMAGQTHIRFVTAEAALTDTPCFEAASEYVQDRISMDLADPRDAFLHADMAIVEDIALLYHAVAGVLPDNAAINHWARQDLDPAALADVAHAAYARGHGGWASTAAQMRDLIAQVWGSASDEWVSIGTAFIERGGSWAEGLLYLARHENHTAALRDAQGWLPVMQDLMLDEVGWSPDGGNNALYGGAGNDRLVGGRGDDLLDGGTGIDLVVYTGNLADYALGLRQDAAGETDLVLRNVRTGETDVLRDVELAEIGGVIYGARPDAPALALDHFIPLADCVRVVGVQELASLGVPDAWLA